MTKNAHFGGILPAVASPCDDADRFLDDTFAELVTSLWKTGINGLYVCGSTGDGFKMCREERKRAAEIAVELSRKHDGTVIVHVGASNSRDAMMLAEHAAEIGASAVSSIPPANTGQDQLISYYTDIAKASQIPLLLYYIPVLTGKHSTLDEMLGLLDIPGAIGLKLTDWNLFFMKRLLLARPDIVVFNGYDEFLLPGLLYGAHGGIGTTYNLFPKLFVEIYQSYKKGDIDRAMQLQNHLVAFCHLAWKHGVPAIFERLMKARGFGAHCFRKPRPTIDDEVYNRIEPQLNKLIAAIDETVEG